MRCVALSKRKPVSLVEAVSPALITATVLLGATIVAGATGALAQSSSGTATRGVPDAGMRDDPGRAPDATTSDVTPAFANTPTPAFSNTPTPAFSGTPTPALSDTQTSPIGSTAASPSVDGTASGGATGTMSTDNATSADISIDRTGGIAAQGSQADRPARRADTGTTFDGPTDRVGPADANALDAGSIVVRSRSGGNETDPAFVIVPGPPAVNAPATRPMQFTMICNGSIVQSGCKPPPRFIATAK